MPADPQHIPTPPFNGQPCPMCPVEVRNLYACADNAVRAIEAATNGTGSTDRAARKLGELKEAIAWIKPLIDAHFADPAHWEGTPA